MSKEFYDPDRAEAAAELWDKLRQHEGEDNDAQLIIEKAMSEYACTADKRIEDSDWAQKYKAACIELSKQAEEVERLRQNASTAVKQGEHWHKIADKLRSALLRTTGSLGLIIKGAGSGGPGHKANYEHATKVLDETC